MSIRPVDMQIMVQKTPDTAKTSQIENQRPEILQQATADRLVKETIQNEERIMQTEHTQGESVNKDGRGGAEYQKRKNRRGKERRTESESKEHNNGFDISI